MLPYLFYISSHSHLLLLLSPLHRRLAPLLLLHSRQRATPSAVPHRLTLAASAPPPPLTPAGWCPSAVDGPPPPSLASADWCPSSVARTGGQCTSSSAHATGLAALLDTVPRWLAPAVSALPPPSLAPIAQFSAAATASELARAAAQQASAGGRAAAFFFLLFFNKRTIFKLVVMALDL